MDNKVLLIFTLLIVGVVNEILTINRIKRNLSIFKGSPVLEIFCIHRLRIIEATVQGDFFWLDKRLTRRLL